MVFPFAVDLDPARRTRAANPATEADEESSLMYVSRLSSATALVIGGGYRWLAGELVFASSATLGIGPRRYET